VHAYLSTSLNAPPSSSSSLSKNPEFRPQLDKTPMANETYNVGVLSWQPEILLSRT
jgi:hypothetical protein